MISQSTYALLQLSMVRGIGPARLRRAAALLQDAKLARSPADLGEGLSPEQLAQLAESRVLVDALVDDLCSIGVRIIGMLDSDYPSGLRERLGERVPPVLMVRGDDSLLRTPSVGFCGSRAASDRGLQVADDCAEQLARAGVTVTSGYAAGVDVATHAAALRAGGSTVLVLAEGIQRFRVKSELTGVWDWTRVCVVSEFSAGAAWSVGNAMQRNRTIVGLSRAMILIEAGATGGSIAAGRDALSVGVPLFAPEYEGMPQAATGNRELLRSGAHPLYRTRATMRANLDPVLCKISTDSHGHPTQQRQISLLS